MIEHIVFATDGSAPAERAGDFTASLATRYGARVTVVHAYAPMPTFLGEPYHSQMVNKVLGGRQPLRYLVQLILVGVFVVLSKPFSLPILAGAYIASGVIGSVKDQFFAHMPAVSRAPRKLNE